MNTIVLPSPIDGKPVAIRPSSGSSKKQWAAGKCWTAYCSNPIWCVHLTPHGAATHGYCYSCVERAELSRFVRQLPRLGSWAMLEKGKLVEWAFDAGRLSFSPVPPKRKAKRR